jgi:hypothetical protein
MLDSVWNVVFRCSHKQLSRPLTPAVTRKPTRPGGSDGQTYVVCLDCGKHFAYDAREMRLGKALEAAEPVHGVVVAQDPPVERFRLIKLLVWASLPIALLFGAFTRKSKPKP